VTETARKRGRPRKPETDAAILRAGFEMFCERGVEGVSMEQIASRAGVGKLTVYRRWASKEELLAAAIELAFDDQGRWPTNDELAGAPVARTIEAIMPAAVEAAISPEYRALIAQILGSAVSHPQLLEIYWRRRIEPRRRATTAMLRQAQRDGRIRQDVDLDVLIDMMAGAVIYRVLQPDPPDAAEMHRYLTELYRAVGLIPSS
jgi:AcrR family transcriptional regulator